MKFGFLGKWYVNRDITFFIFYAVNFVLYLFLYCNTLVYGSEINNLNFNFVALLCYDNIMNNEIY